MSVPQLGYWKIRGLAQPIRLLFDFVGQNYEEVFYECGPAPEWSRQSWLEVKENLKLDFPNLPYLVHEEVRITESWAILKYIAHKWAPETLGKSLFDKIQVDQLQGVLTDIKSAVTMPQYTQPDRQVVVNLFNDRLKRVSTYLGEKKFLVGEYVTLPDFYLFELLEVAGWVSEGKIWESYPNLASYHKRFSQLPEVQKHFANNSTVKLQFNNVMAKINN